MLGFAVRSLRRISHPARHDAGAFHLYRSGFKPSKHIDRPYAMLGAKVIAADYDAEVRAAVLPRTQAFTTNFGAGGRGPFRRRSTI